LIFTGGHIAIKMLTLLDGVKDQSEKRFNAAANASHKAVAEITSRMRGELLATVGAEAGGTGGNQYE
jgi:hypothetical protein